jgi:hypothetical protein
MTEADPPPQDVETEEERRRANLVLLVVFAVVVAIGAWLVIAMAEQRKVDDCLAQGRRNCAPIDAPR